MLQVFSVTVSLTSTTLSSWLAQVMMLGPSRTPGVHLGVRMDISDLPKETHVMSAKDRHSQYDVYTHLKLI